MSLSGQKRTRSQRVAVIELPSTGVWATLQQIRQRGVWPRLGLCFLGISILWLAAEPWFPPFPFRTGYTPDRDIRTTITFTTVDEDATRRARAERESQVPYIFANDPKPLVRLREELDSVLSQLLTAEEMPDWWREFMQPAAPAQPPNIPAVPEPTQEEMLASFERFRQMISGKDSLAHLRETVQVALAPYEARGVLDKLPESGRNRVLEKRDAIIVYPADQPDNEKARQLVPVSEVLLGDGSRLAGRLSSKADTIVIADHLFHWLRRHLPKSTLTYDQARTQLEREKAGKGVGQIEVTYEVGTPLAYRGKPLRPEDLGLLKIERDRLVSTMTTQEKVSRSIAWLGVILCLFCVAGYYGRSIEPRIGRDTGHLAVVLLSVGATLILSRWLSGDQWRAEIIPILFCGMLLGVAYAQFFALLVSVILCVLVVAMLGQSFGTLVVMLGAVATSIAMVRRIRSRMKLIVVGFTTGCLAAGLTIVVGLLDGQPLLLAPEGQPICGLLVDAVRNFGWCLVAGFLISGALPFLEGQFLLTDIKLLELGDVSHPLLQELVRRAPGTYNHSINVASMAEAAADTIGANGLLVRVGAYFHDIGKMFKPDYFVENQTPGQNRHDTLLPAMSTLIIIAHVKDGADLARQHNLPQQIIDFIEQHHGMTLVQYFYDRASAQNNPDNGQVEESSFRYPGPKPQTREAAVLMLADCVESATRVLAEPTATRIRNLVHGLAMKRLMDGQFDECGLNLRELKTIEDSLVKSLIAMYHGRVKYQENSSRGEEPSSRMIPTTKPVTEKVG